MHSECLCPPEQEPEQEVSQRVSCAKRTSSLSHSSSPSWSNSIQSWAYSILPVPNREESPPRKKRVPNHDFVQTGGSGEVWGPSIGGSFLGQIFSSCSRQKWPKPCRGGQQTHTPYHLLLRGSGVFYWQFEHFQHLFYKKNTMGRFGPHCAHDH